MSSLGLSLKVSPEMAESLRQGRTQGMNETAGSDHAAPLLHEHQQHAIEEDPPFSSEEHHMMASESEDWDDLIPCSLPPEQHSDDENVTQEEDGDNGDSDDDDVSTSPPPSLPLVVVNLEKLCGYTPSTEEEAQELRNQVSAALLQDEDDNEQQQQQESLSSHFEDRVSELFNAGMAFHADTSSNTNQGCKGFCTVSYPEFLCRNDGKVVVTSRQWKLLLKPHKIQVVHRLLQHCTNCNRPFSWKVDMHQQLRHLARMQQEERVQHNYEQELREWRTEGRKTKLDKLYQVRETFDHRLEVAQQKLQDLQEEREEEVRRELRSHGPAGGLEGLDFDSATPFAFPETATSTTPLVNEYNGESDTDDGYIQSNDEESLSGDDSSLDDTTNELMASTKTTPSSSGVRARRRLNKRRRQLLQSQADAAQRALERSKIEQARQEEERVRNQCALTPQVHMAQAVVQSLQERMKQVDDLLESLQEEEWADEEENQDGVGAGDPSCEETNQDGLTLLDQILAMILGALPQGDRSKEDHFKFVHEEHQRIKKEWKEHFGRLPVSLATSVNPEATATATASAGQHSNDEFLEHRMQEMSIAPTATQVEATQSDNMSVSALKKAFGIVDIEGDWDDINDWDEVLPSAGLPEGGEKSSAGSPVGADTIASKKKPSTKPGLRPGGKV